MKIVSFSAAALAGVTSFALAGLAQAQPAPSAPPPESAPTYDWTGLYIGANAGWRWSDARTDTSPATVNQLTGVNGGAGLVTVPPTSFVIPGATAHGSNGTWGGQIGFNKQSGPLVFGFEGDMDALYGRSTQTNLTALPATGLTTGAAVASSRSIDPHWTASARARLGWAMGPVLLYGTGGLAWANLRESDAYAYAPAVTGAVAAANPGVAFGPYANGDSRDKTLMGWTLGGGGEFMLTRNISVGAEYRHSDYGHAAIGSGGGGPNTVSSPTRVNFSDDAVLGKVNFRFGRF